MNAVVEKLKWDGRVSGRWRPPALLAAPGGRILWSLPAGAVHERPSRGTSEVLSAPVAGAAGPGWWVAWALGAPDGSLQGYKVDAAAPAARRAGARLVFVDLDLDLELGGRGEVVLDVAVFRERARDLRYPRRVREHAWRGLEDAAAAHARGQWPFDGTLAGLLG